MNTLTKHLFLALITSLSFSAFIYFEYFDITNKIINTIFALTSLALFLHIPKRAIFMAGFFIGILWFYWIGYSFEYQGVGYLTPFITLFFGFVYMLFFATLTLSDKVYIRAIILFLLSFVEIVGFNWMQIELIFVDSYICVEKYQFAITLISLSLVSYVNKKIKYLPLLLLLLSLNYNTKQPKLAPLKIKLTQTMIKQEDKWKKENLLPTVEKMYIYIKKAISEKYDVIVSPESVFPLYMNHNYLLLKDLQNLSKQITIVAGSLFSQNNQLFNVTYIFNNGTYKIAKKVVLVPFGEYIPLPKFAQKFINDTFFGGTSDFIGAKEPTDFTIKGIKFRNAICYEATSPEIYKGDLSYVIAISNNGWFTPSIEPTLQKLLMRYYARKNNVVIYHSSNIAGTGIIY